MSAFRRKTVAATALAIASALAYLAAQAPRQTPPVTFKVEINYVEVDAFVVDGQGTLVRDLRQDEFRVLEDGKPQTVTAFSFVDLPVERPDRPLFAKQPIEPDVATNARGVDGRLYLIVLDDLDTGQMRTARVRAAAKKFVQDQLGVNDLAAVTTTGFAAARQEFTNNRALLVQAIDRFTGTKLRSPTLERLDEYARQANRQVGDPVADPLEAQRAFRARSVFDSLRQWCDILASVRGRRKALVFISEGIDYNIDDPINNPYAGEIRDSVRDAISAATRANVNIYSIDPRGLTDMGDELIGISALPGPGDADVGGPSTLLRELRLSQDSLRVISDETGGFASVNTNDTRGAFTRIVQENSAYYVLGYYSTNERRDGRFRKIDLTVTRPGLTVRTRRGYAAVSGKPRAREAPPMAGVSSELREVLDSPVPVSGFTLAAAAAPLKGDGGQASVLVTVQGSGGDLTFTEKDGRFDNVVEASVLAIDGDGRIKAGDRASLSLAVKPETLAALRQVGFRVLLRLPLPPGKYQLRVAARESGAGRMGSVYDDLEVPDFTRLPLSMSGLILSSRQNNVVPTPRPDETLQKLLAGHPTTARDFRSDDELVAAAEVYDTQGDRAHKVNITTTLLTDAGTSVFNRADERSSSELRGRTGGYGYSVRVPLKGLAPGLYVLRVEARSTLGKEAQASREVVVRVR
jgi:VWFA-related protein